MRHGIFFNIFYFSQISPVANLSCVHLYNNFGRTNKFDIAVEINNCVIKFFKKLIYVLKNLIKMSSDQFCSEELWNLNLTWFSDSPDFTPCFHKTVLVYLPCAFLWLLSPIEFRSNFVSKNRFIPWSWLTISKVVSTGLLGVLSLLELVRFSLLSKDQLNEVEIVGADFASSSVKLATFCFSILLVLLAKRAGKYLQIFSVWVADAKSIPS